MTSWPNPSRLRSWRRIRAVVRRGNRAGRAVLQVNDLELDRITHGVRRQGRQIDLRPKEFSLLELLMRHAGQLVSRQAIVEEVWKLNCDTMTNVVGVSSAQSGCWF
jgi:two-component system, OmpR family, response regulator